MEYRLTVVSESYSYYLFVAVFENINFSVEKTSTMYVYDREKSYFEQCFREMRVLGRGLFGEVGGCQIPSFSITILLIISTILVQTGAVKNLVSSLQLTHCRREPFASCTQLPCCPAGFLDMFLYSCNLPSCGKATVFTGPSWIRALPEDFPFGVKYLFSSFL